MVKKLVKRGDSFKEAKLRASLNRAGVLPKQSGEIVVLVKKYVAKESRPTTLGVRKIVEVYLKKENPKAHKKYHVHKK
ncbi:MAG: hypothetical protein ABII22_02160 [Candidatus Micrarchaeota archaeon]